MVSGSEGVMGVPELPLSSTSAPPGDKAGHRPEWTAVVGEGLGSSPPLSSTEKGVGWMWMWGLGLC